MTHITPDRAPDPVGSVPQEVPFDDTVVPEQRGTEPLIPVELRGCPTAVPGTWVTRAQVAEGRLKIPCANGYDHFEFDSYVSRNGRLVPVFAWIDRTRIAE